jgi:hypothetical protein
LGGFFQIWGYVEGLMLLGRAFRPCFFNVVRIVLFRGHVNQPARTSQELDFFVYLTIVELLDLNQRLPQLKMALLYLFLPHAFSPISDFSEAAEHQLLSLFPPLFENLDSIDHLVHTVSKILTAFHSSVAFFNFVGIVDPYLIVFDKLFVDLLLQCLAHVNSPCPQKIVGRFGLHFVKNNVDGCSWRLSL